MIGHRSESRGSIVLLAAVVFLLALPAWPMIQHPNLERGFSAETAFQIGDIDHVNLFNGGLSLTIPIGNEYPIGGSFSYQLTLVYSSKVWDWETICVDSVVPTICQHQPRAGLDFNAGMGWMLSLGQVVPPNTMPRNETGQWLYLGADGAEHVFYRSLLSGGTTDTGVHYARDNSYLRLREVGGGVEIDFPDGTVHGFGSSNQLDWMRDAFGNELTVGRNGAVWTLDDGHRSHKIFFSDLPMDGELRPLVTKVELAPFGGGPPAKYTFTYEPAAVERPDPFNPATPPPGLPVMPSTATVQILTKVSLPDGSTYAMPRARHNITCPTTPGVGCFDTGTIERLTLPTLGHIEWAYAKYFFPRGTELQRPMEAPPELRFTWLTEPPGVATRRLLTRGASVIGSWRYEQAWGRLGSTVGGFKDREIVHTVFDPAGNKTEHYFVTLQRVDSVPEDAKRRWVYGLPYTPFASEGSGTRRGFLSRITFKGTNNFQQRTHWVRYEKDAQNGQQTKQWNLNRRVAYEKTKYLNGSVAETRRSGFDNLGHYRTNETLGNFGQGDSRFEFTNWNPAGAIPNKNQAWLLKLFDETRQSEGFLTERQTYCFDGKGFLSRRRVHKNASGQSADDVVVELLRDGDGNLTRERFFGGDNKVVSTGSNLCTIGLSGWDYSISHANQYGSRKRSTYFRSSGSSMGFHILDTDIDRSTGLVAASRDVSGLIRSAFTYDTLGRIEWIKPPPGHGSWVQFLYTPAHIPADKKARVEIRRHRNGSSGLPFLENERFVFDALGRLTREERLMPDGTMASRDTTYHAMGWKTGVSEWRRGSEFVGWTRFQNFDPFGRPTRIEPPDGAQHAVTISYGGVKTVSRTLKVRLSGNATTTPETSVTTTETFDRQGRLWKVDEPGNGLLATYRYDPGGRLTRADLWNGGSTTQVRRFTYDGRGFLTRECHPEKSGCVSFSRIDARGHALQRDDNGNRLKFAFDQAERLLRVSTGSNRVIKEFEYQTTNSGSNLRKGRLWKATRHNFGEAPWAPGNFGTISVTEEYFYAGRDGRVSKRNTTAGPDVRFSQQWTYDDLGDVTTLTYPRCTNTDCTSTGGGGPFRQQSISYAAGRMRAVSGFINRIDYHPSGMTHEIRHANGTLERFVDEPSGMARPVDIQLVLGNGQTIAFGQHKYDGAGNLIVRGTEFFIYDHLSRIKRWQKDGGPNPDPYQAYTHDTFGNLISVTSFDGTTTETRNIAVVAQTNRLSGAQYDGRGNLLVWGSERYRWDETDMLFQRDFPQDTNIYTADDERICTIRWDGTTIAETWTLRDLDNQVLRVYERDVNLSNSVVAWRWVQDYFHDDKGTLLLSVGDRPGAQRNLHYATDHLGSPLVTTDRNGNIFATDSFWAYGETAGTTGPLARRRFTGHERDVDLTGRPTDLDYMHAREYAPWIGRFLSVDPAQRPARPMVPQSWNRYSYGLNNPLKFVDPDGEAVALKGSEKLIEFNSGVREGVRAKLEPIPVIGKVSAFVADVILSGFFPVSASEVSLPGMPVATVSNAGGIGSSALKKLARQLKLNADSPSARKLLGNLDMKVSDFVAKFRKGSIKQELPSEFAEKTVKEALREGDRKIRKLLVDKRFAKE